MERFITDAQIHEYPLMRIILFICLFLPSLLLAQNPKKAQRAYDKAVEFYRDKADDKAESLAKQALRQDSSFLKPYLLLGQLSEEQGETEEAVDYYLKGLADDNPRNAWGYWKVGKIAFSQGDYQEAKLHLDHFLTFEKQSSKYIRSAKYLLTHCRFAIEALKDPVPFQPENMGEGVNSKWEEYLPSISAEGDLFVFTRRGPHQENIVSEDFYASTLKDGSWSKAENLGQALNTFGNEGAQCLSSDGKILFFTACDREDGYGRCDIYVSFLEPQGWSPAQNIGPSINSEHWESQPSISPDGQELYFVSNRPGGQGKMDIWKSTLTASGSFGSPVNLGRTINTPFDEMSPFVHMDNQTLYFASKGHPGMGDFDLFLSRRANAVEAWEKPENLGYPINTYEVENSLIVASDGQTAYFASDKSGYGQEDIFWFELPLSAQPNQVEGLELEIISQESGSEIILENVHFAHNSYELDRASADEVDKLIAYLHKHPEVKILIEGHTDDVGDEKANQLLSENRAKAVYLYISDAFIDSRRLSYKGFGESKPLVDNSTEKGRAKNRRTSFRIQ
jgi:outer membrane protein OmpA-like peptidoglycan-associated protein